MELQPVLEGELVRLRPLRPADYDELYAVARDPLIWAQHPASDRHEPAVFREFFREALHLQYLPDARRDRGDVNGRAFPDHRG